MIRSVAVGLAVFLLASTAVAPVAGSTAAAGAGLAAPDGFDQTVFDIEVYENGTAEWTFQYSRPLANDTERQQFESFVEEFESTETRIYRDFLNRSAVLTEVGTDATGRQMNATAYDRRAYVDQMAQIRGVVQMSFHWSNFAVVEDERVVAADVFDGGLYIGQDQRLVFSTGPNLAFDDVDPKSYSAAGETLASSDTVTWFGEQQFADERPRIVYAPAGAETTDAAGTTAAAADETATPTENAGNIDRSMTTESDAPTTASTATAGSSDMMLAVLALLLFVGIVGAAVWQFGGFGGGATTGSEPQSPDASPEPDQQAAAGDPVPDEELLSDSDRVVKLLEDNGGRMKQVNIVEKTEWSKSKVSMLLSDMEEEGVITKLRVGRENIISLAGHEPDAAGSPFDDEE